MRIHALLAATVALALSAGCESSMRQADVPDDGERAANEQIVRTLFDQDVRNAIVAERTVYPYHFDPDHSSLNELGERQVEVLAPAHRGPRVRISVLRGDADAALYDARVQAVRQRLVASGRDPATLTITEDAPGGRGISSKSVVEFMQQRENGDSASGEYTEPTRNGMSQSTNKSTGGSPYPTRQGTGR
jgi:hypothetical protein